MISLHKEIIFVEKKKDDVIFYEGDHGKKFYIIIEGKVDVLEEIKDPDVDNSTH